MTYAFSVRGLIRGCLSCETCSGKKIPVIGELELAFEECICPVVAITGTNGKTTTTELTTVMLRDSGVRTMASGNIGLPFATAVRQSTELDVMILEVSSFQLETIDAFRPQVAVWLNFSPNHLDRYRDLEDYRKAKLRVFMNQTPEDYAIVNARENLPPISARRITFSAYEPGADFTLRDGVIFYQGEPVLDQRKTRLEGFHNAENLMAALGVGLALGVELETMAAAVGEFTAPVHRCEFVRDFEGVRWINDSKATNLDSVEKAIHSQTRPTVLIAGGKDKAVRIRPIAPLVRERVLVAILIGEMKERIAASWSGVDCRISSSLKRPSPRRGKLPRPEDAVLFSPGTSSFDMFRNYGERGNRFKDAVNALK
mgnify:CR=1 FL=1